MLYRLFTCLRFGYALMTKVNCHIFTETAESNLSCHCAVHAIVIGDSETTSVFSVTFMVTHTRTYASIKNVNMLALGLWLAADALWRSSQSTCLRYFMGLWLIRAHQTVVFFRHNVHRYLRSSLLQPAAPMLIPHWIHMPAFFHLV